VNIRTGAFAGPAFQAAAAATVATLPVFLFGALSVEIGKSLGTNSTATGLVVASFFAAATVSSLLAARVLGSGPPARAVRMAVLLSSLCMLGVAVSGYSLAVIAAWSALAGLADGMAQPSINAFLAERIAVNRQGLAFGIKQSGIPTSTLLGGAAVPLVALTVGWRWAFVGAAVLALVVGLTIHGRPDASPNSNQMQPVTKAAPAAGSALALVPLAVLAAAAALGAGAANALGAFLVPGGVAAGLPEGLAGWLAAAGSGCGLATRLYIGLRADRQGRGHFQVVAAMLIVGSLGYVLLSLGAVAALIAGTALAFSAGWGWNGLFNYAVVRSHPSAPARSTGITQAGVFVGAIAIPPLFGLIASSSGYATAWLVASGATLAGGIFMLVGSRLMDSRSSGQATSAGL
jgi:predicted MFS family arabinose efflux permease